MSNAMGPAVLDGLPDRLLSKTFSGMNGDVEVFALDVMKCFHMLLKRVAAFLAGKIESNDASPAEVHRQFRHFQRDVHIAHGTDNHAGANTKVLATTLQTFEHSQNSLLMGQPLTDMKNEGKASLEINYTVAAQVFRLLIGDAIQRFLGLHHCDSVRKPLKVFRQTALIRAVVEPVRQLCR